MTMKRVCLLCTPLVEAKDMTRLLDDDEKGRQIVPILGGNQEMNTINESGRERAELSGSTVALNGT